MQTISRLLSTLLGVALLLRPGLAVCVEARGVPHYLVPTVATPVGTPAQLVLGEKLVQAICAEGHFNKQTGQFSGHQLWDTPSDFGTVYAANITQHPTHGIEA